jgi:hypothetical protein
VCQDDEKAGGQKNKCIERTGWYFGKDCFSAPPWVIEPIQNIAGYQSTKNENFRG